MASITMIPAKKRVGTRVVQDEVPKTRVAAYCRVSTDTDEQATSYEAQVEHYTKYIKQNPAWESAGIYADDGISGTNTKNRVEFNRLIDDCMAGKIDMVVTKSISRFARNTLDCLKYIRQLKDKNIAVYFEKESINTLDAKGEVMLTIMASLAQQESESLSQNVKLGLQYRYQQGKVQVCTTRFLGYDKDENGKLIINKEEAEVVKRIFREYLEGYLCVRFSETKSTLAMLSCRRLSPQIFLPKRGWRIKGWFHSIISRTIMSQSFRGSCFCVYRRKWPDVPVLKPM